MYIRQISRRRADGSEVAYLQLARKVRDPGRGTPRDEVLYHFGRADSLDRDQLRRLVRSLSRFLQPSGRAEVEAELAGLGSELVAERSVSLGGSYVLDRLWRRLGLDEALEALLAERQFAADIERLIFAMVANRALAPRSKLALERWVGRKAVIDGLGEVAVHSLYRAMDVLVDQGEAVQKAVFFATASLLNLEVDLLLVDTTSVFFEIEQEDDEADGIRRFGHSKDHRPDLPQVVVALAVTRGGIPVRCWVLPGNTADASIVGKVQADLAGWRLNRVVWVMDRGMGGEAQRLALQRGGGQVILGEKLRSGQAEIEAVLSRPGRYRQLAASLEVKEVRLRRGSEQRRFVLVRNPAEAGRDRQQRDQALARLAEELAQLDQGPGHGRKACALETHPVYGRLLTKDASGRLAIDRAKVASELRLDGKYLLSTTDASLSVDDIVHGYKQLADVERAFRTLKTHLDIRPMYHRLPERIQAHVLLCWLALLLVRVIETETGQSWVRLRDELEDLALVTLKGKDGAAEVVTMPTPAQREALNKLAIPPPRPVRRAAISSAAA